MADQIDIQRQGLTKARIGKGPQTRPSIIGSYREFGGSRLSVTGNISLTLHRHTNLRRHSPEELHQGKDEDRDP